MIMRSKINLVLVSIKIQGLSLDKPEVHIENMILAPSFLASYLSNNLLNCTNEDFCKSDNRVIGV